MGLNALLLAEAPVGIVGPQLGPVMIRTEVDIFIRMLPQGIKDRHPLYRRINEAVGIGEGLIHAAGAQLCLHILRQLHPEGIGNQHVIERHILRQQRLHRIDHGGIARHVFLAEIVDLIGPAVTDVNAAGLLSGQVHIFRVLLLELQIALRIGLEGILRFRRGRVFCGFRRFSGGFALRRSSLLRCFRQVIQGKGRRQGCRCFRNALCHAVRTAVNGLTLQSVKLLKGGFSGKQGLPEGKGIRKPGGQLREPAAVQGRAEAPLGKCLQLPLFGNRIGGTQGDIEAQDRQPQQTSPQNNSHSVFPF